MIHGFVADIRLILGDIGGVMEETSSIGPDRRPTWGARDHRKLANHENTWLVNIIVKTRLGE